MSWTDHAESPAGECGANQRRMLTGGQQSQPTAGLRLLVPSSEYAEIISAPPANPFALLTVPIRAVMQSDPENRVCRFRGHKPAWDIDPSGPYGQHPQFFVQDGKNGLRVFARHDATVEPGDRVEVVGLCNRMASRPR